MELGPTRPWPAQLTVFAFVRLADVASPPCIAVHAVQSDGVDLHAVLLQCGMCFASSVESHRALIEGGLAAAVRLAPDWYALLCPRPAQVRKCTHVSY